MKLASPLAALVCAAALSACGGASDVRASAGKQPDGDRKIALVAYSTPEVVYEELGPAFAATPAGGDVGFRSSFGGSGEQSRAVAEGLDADLVTFSIEPDVTRLVEAGLVDRDWKRQHRNDSTVTTSVVSFLVREGNPKNIRTWQDLLRDDVEVITPNPFTSGAAKWNLVAAYAVASDGGRDREAGLRYIRELLQEQVKMQPKSSREALQSFLGGSADVLVSYEYEAVTAQRKGQRLDYVVPPRTIRIDIPFVELEGAPQQARDFADYVFSAPAQRIFAEWGYRPVHPEVLDATRDQFPEPRELLTIEDLGGWKKVDADLFHPRNGEVAKIEGGAER